MSIIDRTFHHQFTLTGKVTVVLLILMALVCFWQQRVLIGLLMVVLVVMTLERILHSQYVFHKGQLIIDRGRFAHRVVIPLSDVTRMEPRTTTWGLVHYILIEYGAHHVAAIQTDAEEAFLRCLERRIEELSSPKPSEGGDVELNEAGSLH